MNALSSIDSYGPQFQNKIISSLLSNRQFITNIHDILDVDYFSSPAHQWIIKEILEYYRKYHTNPSLDVLKIELKKVENDILQVSIKEKLKEAYIASEEDIQYVQEEFTNFCRNQQLKKALLKSVDLLNGGDFEGIRRIVDNALKAGQEKNIGHEYEKDIEERYREENRNPIPTPWPIFNQLLQGGLGEGDFGLIFGNPGGGKSWTLVGIGGEAVRMGYTVVHYTLELSEGYVGKRYDAFFTKIEANEISQHKQAVEAVVPDLPGRLIIKDYPPKRASIYTIEAHIQQLKDQGIDPDLIIIDYADLLRSTDRTKEKKDEIDLIYMDIKGLAKSLHKPIWSVSQVNREGAKEDVIEGTHVQGSYDKTFITDFCASLSRKKEDKVNGTGRFHIMKNRYGNDGMTYMAEVNTGIGHFIIGEEMTEEDMPSNKKQQKINNELAKEDKDYLRNKFFELDIDS